MKILQLGRFYPPFFGGIQNVMYELTTGINAKGVRCDVLCSHNINKFEIQNNKSHIVLRAKSFGIYFSTSISPQMVGLLNKIKNDYDVISIHFPDPMAALALYLVRPKCKIVLHWHSDVIKQKYILKLFKPLQNWVINRADLIVGATEKHIKCSDNYELMKSKSTIIPYPFDLQALYDCVDDVLYKNLKNKYNNKKIVFSMGRLVYYKGFEFLIEAAKELGNDYVILIGGVGKLEKELKDQINESGMIGRVILLGSIPYNQLGTYYKVCDVFCLPSTHRSEMFGIVQLEAMSFGKPVISTKLERSGVCNVNINDKTGICVNAGSAIAIADAIEKITINSEEYKRYSTNALDRVTNVFGKNLIINKVIDTYRLLMDKV